MITHDAFPCLSQMCWDSSRTAALQPWSASTSRTMCVGLAPPLEVPSYYVIDRVICSGKHSEGRTIGFTVYLSVHNFIAGISFGRWARGLSESRWSAGPRPTGGPQMTVHTLDFYLTSNISKHHARTRTESPPCLSLRLTHHIPIDIAAVRSHNRLGLSKEDRMSVLDRLQRAEYLET